MTDLKRLYYLTGVENKPTVFLFNDTQALEESFLEDISNILSSGEVPNLYKPEEFEEVCGKLMENRCTSVFFILFRNPWTRSNFKNSQPKFYSPRKGYKGKCHSLDPVWLDSSNFVDWSKCSPIAGNGHSYEVHLSFCFVQAFLPHPKLLEFLQ